MYKPYETFLIDIYRIICLKMEVFKYIKYPKNGFVFNYINISILAILHFEKKMQDRV